jgi:hypothetical protein
VNRIFIHTNPKQYLGALVAKHCIERVKASQADFEVQIISTTDFGYVDEKHGQAYLRQGSSVKWDKHDLQSFTPLRFLPPQLMGYEGRAIVIDPDVFAIRDISPLFTLDLGGKKIAARKIRPTDGRNPYWASSVMVLDCAKLHHWQWEQQVDEMFSLTRDYRSWISLEDENADDILELEDYWNHYDTLTDQTRFLHNTGRLTQPWKTGLPIDFFKDKSMATSRATSFRGFAKSLLTKLHFLPNRSTPAHYLPHPDKKQEVFFFHALKSLLDRGEISSAFLQDEIQRRHLRPDALHLLERV